MLSSGTKVLLTAICSENKQQVDENREKKCGLMAEGTGFFIKFNRYHWRQGEAPERSPRPNQNL